MTTQYRATDETIVLYEEEATIENMSSSLHQPTGTIGAQESAGTPGPPLTHHQLSAIKSIRRAIDADTCDDLWYDWKEIKPKVKKFGPNPSPLSAADYTIRPVAAWVPHKIFAGYRPHCAHCGQQVQLLQYSWIKNPRILHTVHGFSFLDTVQYKCNNHECKRQFHATDLKSLSKGRNEVVRKAFTIHLMARCAVDEDLFSLILSMKHMNVSAIKAVLDDVRHNRYCSEASDYFVRGIAINNGSHRQQAKEKTIDSFVQRRTQNRSQLRLTSVEAMKLRQLEDQVSESGGFTTTPIQFDNLKSFQGRLIGKLSEAGITNGNQLLEAVDLNGDSLVFRSSAHKEKLKRALDKNFKAQLPKAIRKVKEAQVHQKKSLETKKRQLDELRAKKQASQVGEQAMSQTFNSTNGANDTINPTQHCALPPFPAREAKSTIRFVSEYIIELVLSKNFSQRKPGMIHRMTNLGAQILSLDANYKVAKKLMVVLGDGRRIKPYKCLMTLMNEDNMVVWWALLRTDESITEVQNELKVFKARLDRVNKSQNQTLHAIYVDNCCTFRSKLQEIFGTHVLILLDLFHWLARWDELLRHPNSEDGYRLKALMSRGVLVITNEEWERKKAALATSLNRTPTKKEVAARCNKVTAKDAEDIKTAIRKIIEFTMHQDVERVALVTDDTDAASSLILKDPSLVRKVVAKQLKHIDCLKDPPCGVHFRVHGAEATRVCADFLARGTGGNERLFRDANRKFFLGAALGICRAERILWEYLDEHNIRAQIRRRGNTDYGNSNLEAMALCNSLALEAQSTILFPGISLPTSQPSNERLGFELYREDQLDDVSSSTSLTSTGAECERPDDDSLWSTLQNDDDFNELSRVLDPALLKRQRTSDAFNKFSGGRPWVPFSIDGNDDISKEERQMFDRMAPNYDRNAAKDSRRGYRTFANAWNLEVGRRVIESMENDSVILLRNKSMIQMQTYYDELKSRQDAASNSTDTSAAAIVQVHLANKRSRVNTQDGVVQTRKAFRFLQSTTPRQAYLPLGAPMVQNVSITMPGAMVRPNQNAPFRFCQGIAEKVPKHGMYHPINKVIFCNFCGMLRSSVYHHPSCSKQKSESSVCGKCHKPKSRHTRAKCEFGYYCTLIHPSDPKARAYQKEANDAIRAYRSRRRDNGTMQCPR